MCYACKGLLAGTTWIREASLVRMRMYPTFCCLPPALRVSFYRARTLACPTRIPRRLAIMSKRDGSPLKSSEKKRMRQATFGKPKSTDSPKILPGCTWSKKEGLRFLETETWSEKIPSASPDVGDNLKSKTVLKVAAFDLDSTLIKTKTGGKFPRHPTDFQFLSPKVIPKLREASEDGYLLVVFSNQAGAGAGKKMNAEFVETRFETIVKEIGLPMAVLIATEKNKFRKPCIGMWQELQSRVGEHCSLDLEESFYVGDAAGRDRDFADSDLKFSINVGIKFWTPEQFFLDKPVDPSLFSLKGFDPRELVTVGSYVSEDKGGVPSKKDHLKRVLSDEKMAVALMAGWCGKNAGDKPEKQCLVLMHGPPASGKTTFCKRFLEEEGYVWANNDNVGTVAKCIKVVKEGLASGKSVVVDNTHQNKAAREKFVKLATAHDKAMPVYCLRMGVEKELALHLNVVRDVGTDGGTKRIPPVAFNTFLAKQVEPTADEGFALIDVVEFVPWFKSAIDKFNFTRLS